jgi:hypothetical protein
MDFSPGLGGLNFAYRCVRRSGGPGAIAGCGAAPVTTHGIMVGHLQFRRMENWLVALRDHFVCMVRADWLSAKGRIRLWGAKCVLIGFSGCI